MAIIIVAVMVLTSLCNYSVQYSTTYYIGLGNT